MRHWQPVLLTAAAGLLVFIGLVLVRAGSDRQAALRLIQVRLNELQAQRLDQRDINEMKRVLAIGHNPQEGLLIASDPEAVSVLDKLIRSTAQTHEAKVVSISLTSASANKALPVVRGDLHLIIRDGNIGPFINSLETGSPAIFIESVRIANESATEGDSDSILLDLTASILVYRGDPQVQGFTP